MKKKETIKVIVSLDVEEEGLFCGKYKQTQCTVHNVKLLTTLKHITTELGYPLTLLCAYTVFDNSEARKTLSFMRDKVGAEIGAHLHHWSTPPFDTNYNEKNMPQRTHKLKHDLLYKRIQSLLKIGKEFQGADLTSFRMGRWDLKSKIRTILAEEKILVDSSITPHRYYQGGADHFLAPIDPYWAKLSDEHNILEVPITQVAYLPILAKLWYKIGKQLPTNIQGKFIDKFKYFGVLSANPVWHNSWVMKMATKFHIAKGGRVITLFWHSSEMLAGASPNTPDQEAAKALIKRIYNYLEWLKQEYQVQGITLSNLHSHPISNSFNILPNNENDW